MQNSCRYESRKNKIEMTKIAMEFEMGIWRNMKREEEGGEQWETSGEVSGRGKLCGTREDNADARSY